MGRGSLEILQARNVSRSGIGVYVPHGFAACDLDGEVGLVVTLPGERPFLARGRIRHWTDGGGEGQHFGLNFTHLTRANRAAIKAYVRRLLASA